MKIWTTTDARGHYPVGTCVVVVASTEAQAMQLVLDACEAAGIPQCEEDISRIKLERLSRSRSAAYVLLDGSY